MQTNLFFGGAQSPLSRSFLRSVTIPHLDLGISNPQIYAGINDIDTPGIRTGERTNSFLTGKKLIIPVEAKETWSRTEKKEWLPISWKFPFQGSGKTSKYLVNIGYPENLTIRGLPFTDHRVKDSLIHGSFAEIDAVLAITTHPELRERLKHPEALAITERAFRLKKFILSAAETVTTINDFWLEIAKFMLPGKMDGIQTDPLSDFFNLSPDTVGNDQFYLLERFLSKPEKSLALYSEFKPSPDNMLPFWAVHNYHGHHARETITRKRGGRIYIGNTEIGAGIKSVGRLAEALQSTDLGPISIVPKVFLLIPTFRYMGVHYCTDPGYMDDLIQFSKRMGIRQNSLLTIKYDVSMALSSHLWTMCCHFLKAQNPGIELADYNKQITNWKSNPTLTFLWVLGGEEVVEKLIRTASKKWM